MPEAQPLSNTAASARTLTPVNAVDAGGSERRPIGLYTATSIVVANMVGTGVFTSLGFQVLGLHSVFALMLLWIIGGIAATCGALAYGELGASMPRSGGEYQYLSRIYHPVVGFLSGWVSATVGFAAPVALAAVALGEYASRVFPALHPQAIAVSVVILLTLIHAGSAHAGRRFQDVFTTIEVFLILLFIAAGLSIGGAAGHTITLLSGAGGVREIFSKDFAISLFFVSYAYSGWNASAYIAGEIERPQVNLPRSLVLGTLGVTALYVLLNYVFLYTTPMDQLAGKVEVGYVAATSIFGAVGGKLIGTTIALLLVSSVSSMIMTGPRVTQAMGEDVHLLRWFGATNGRGVPAFAIATQSAITLLLILTSTFERVLTYMGFTLNLFTMLTVAGVIVLRIRQPELRRPSRMWGYPYTAIVFLTIGMWLLVYGLIYKPFESLCGLVTVAIGLAIYMLEMSVKSKRVRRMQTDGDAIAS